MAQLQRPSQNSTDAMISEGVQEGRQGTDSLVQESPMKVGARDDAMSPETGGDQEGTRAYNSTMSSLPFQGDQLGMGAGETLDVGAPVSAVFTKREIYVTPGGDVTEQVTEYSTTTTMQPGAGAGAGPGNTVTPTAEDADRLLRSAEEQANYAQQQLGFDPFYNVAAGYEQMNPTSGYGNEAFSGTAVGQLSPVLGFPVTNPDISTSVPTATAAYADVGTIGAAEGGSHPTKTTSQ